MYITKRISNNVFWLVLSEASSRALIFLGTVYLARILGKAGFGLFSLSLAVATYFWMVSNMGVSDYGTREIAKNNEKTAELYSILNSLRFILATSLFMIFGVVLYFINIPVERKLIFLGGAFYAVAFTLSSDWVFRGLEKMKYIMFGRATTSLFFIGGIYLFVNTPSDTFLAPIIYSTSFLVGSLTFIIILRQKFKIPFHIKISLAKWWFHIKKSVYFALNAVLYNIAIFIPVFFMGFLSTDEELGIFSAPHRLSVLAINTVLLIVMAFYPTLSNFYVSDKDSFKKTYTNLHKLIVAITAPACISATILGKDIIVLFYGELYADSTGIFIILIWLIFVRLLRSSVSNALLSADFLKFNMYASASGAAVVILACIVLIPRFGGYGAAWALISGEILTMVLMIGIFNKKLYQLAFFDSYLAKVLFVSVVMGLLIINLPVPRILGIFIGILVYFLLSLNIGIVSKHAIQQFYEGVIRR